MGRGLGSRNEPRYYNSYPPRRDLSDQGPIAGYRELRKELQAKPWPVVPHYEGAVKVEQVLVRRIDREPTRSFHGNSSLMAVQGRFSE